MAENPDYTIEQVRKILRVRRETVRKFIASGELTAYNVGTKNKPSYRISREALEAFKCKESDLI